MKLLTCLGTGTFNTPNARIDGAEPIIMDGGAGVIDGLHVGIEIHDGNWKAGAAARADEHVPYPPVDSKKAKALFAKVEKSREYVSNFNELRFDDYHINETAKVLRAAKARGLKGVGHYGFPNWRFGLSAAEWMKGNDKAMKKWRPSLTMLNPQVYVPDALAGAKELPFSFVLQTIQVIEEAYRLANGNEEVVPVISDRTISGRYAAPGVLLKLILQLLAALGIKRVILWSDKYDPAVGAVVKAETATAAAGGVSQS